MYLCGASILPPPWKWELSYFSSILRQHLHFNKYCHFLHTYSNCLYTEPLPAYPATEALDAVGCECEHLLFWFFKHLEFKMLKWLMQKLSRVIEALLTPQFFQMTPVPDSSCGRSVSSKPRCLAVEEAQTAVIYCSTRLQATNVIMQHWSEEIQELCRD